MRFFTLWYILHFYLFTFKQLFIMLQTTIIGHIGNDAEVKITDGREFTTFRVAHSDKWRDDTGSVHESTTWIDCVMDGRPKVLEYLKRGQMIYCSGGLRLRVFSSAKDRCMKAGATIQVRSLELLGGKADEVPSQIVDADGQLHNVTKHYYCADAVRGKNNPEYVQVYHPRSMQPYCVDRNGFIKPIANDSAADTTHPSE